MSSFEALSHAIDQLQSEWSEAEDGSPCIHEQRLNEHALFKPFISGQQPISDRDMASLILDPNREWLNVFVSTNNNGHPISFLAYLWSLRISGLDDDIPESLQALDDRYSPEEQVDLFRWAPIRLPSSPSLVRRYDAMAGRVAQIALRSDAHLEAWVTETVRCLQHYELMHSLDTDSPFSARYRTSIMRWVDPSDVGIGSLLTALSAAYAMAPEAVDIAFQRYTKIGSFIHVLEHFEGKIFGGFSQGPRVAGVVDLALSLHQHDNVKAIIKRIDAQKVVDRKSFDLAATILHSSPGWDDEYIDISSVLKLGAQKIVLMALDKGSLGDSNRWIRSLEDKPHCASIRAVLGSFDTFRRWALSYSVKTRYGSLRGLTQLDDWMAIMSSDDRQMAKDFLIEKFESEIKTKKEFGRGILYGKLLISAFGDDLYAVGAVSKEVGYLVKRAILDREKEFLSVLVKEGLIHARHVASCVRSLDEFNIITASDKGLEAALRPHLHRNIKIEMIEDDFLL